MRQHVAPHPARDPNDLDQELGRLPIEHQHGEVAPPELAQRALPDRARARRSPGDDLDQPDAGEEKAAVPQRVGHEEHQLVSGRGAKELQHGRGPVRSGEEERHFPRQPDHDAEPEELDRPPAPGAPARRDVHADRQAESDGEIAEIESGREHVVTVSAAAEAPVLPPGPLHGKVCALLDERPLPGRVRAGVDSPHRSRVRT